MAATDRQNPNLDDFVGLNWSCWVEKVNILPSDDNSKYGRTHSETMALSKEDMHIYGHCPAHDEICLVVCSLCGHLIKAQAFAKHWERLHSPLNMKCSQSSDLAHQQGPCPGPSLLNLSSSKETVTKTRYHEASSSHTTLPAHQQSSKKVHKENGRYEEINEKMTMLSSVGQSISRSYSWIHRNTGKNKFDSNRLFRVLDPEKKRKASSQEPISNSSLGRRKVIDQSLGQKMASKERHMEQHLVKLKVRGQYLEDKSITGGSKHNSHCHSSRPVDPPHNYTEAEGDTTVEVEVQLPYPFNQRLLSGEEGEEDKEQEVTDLSWHPKPLGLCTFGCRTLGCNIFTFDRRWQHLRVALSAMLEHYVSTHTETHSLVTFHVTPAVAELLAPGAQNLPSQNSLVTKSSTVLTVRTYIFPGDSHMFTALKDQEKALSLISASVRLHLRHT